VRVIGGAEAARGIAGLRRWVGLIVVSAGLVASSGAAAAKPLTPAGGESTTVHRACRPPALGYSSCFALVSATGAVQNGARRGVQPLLAGGAASLKGPAGGAASLKGPAGGLTPEDLASAYEYDPEASGSGQTVGIVDAFDDPAIEADLETFDAEYGLRPCGPANGCFRKVGQSGGTLPEADKTGWSIEIALDVETVHAVCPHCRILLVEAASNSNANLATATNEAVTLGATVVSNSYGGLEIGATTSQEGAYNHPGIPIVASTGDDGYYDWRYLGVPQIKKAGEMPNTPAALPTVVAVGGTSLTLNETDGTRASESVWSGSGGGCSHRFAAAPWQQAVAGFSASGCGAARLDADVSAVANPKTGFDIYDTYNCGAECSGADEGWEKVGGTSLSAPLISSLYALAGGGNDLPYPSLTLYGQAADSSSRFDVTEGTNGFCEGLSAAECSNANDVLGLVDCEGTTACNAVPGFDGPSGVGTPKGLGLFIPQLPTARISAPASLVAETPAGFGAGSSSAFYPGDTITSAAWSWGDGTNGGGVSSGHAYASPGTYTVTVTVTDSYGLSASTTTSVNVAPAPAPAGSRATTPVAAGTAAVPGARLASAAITAGASGAVKIKISCPAGVGSCRGTVTLRTLTAVSAGRGKRKVIVLLGTVRFSLASGDTTTVTVHLSAKARALLARLRTLRVLAMTVASDPAGATHTTRQTLTLRAAAGRPRKH
jgi:hypothetical protein